jgi:hypothetical protein
LGAKADIDLGTLRHKVWSAQPRSARALICPTSDAWRPLGPPVDRQNRLREKLISQGESICSDYPLEERLKFRFRFTENRASDSAIPIRCEGRVATVTSVGLECGGCGRIAGRAIWLRTAKACGPGTPGLVLSVRAMTARDGDYEVTDTGESTRISVNTIAQGKPDCSVYL